MDRLHMSIHTLFTESAISALFNHQIFTAKDFILSDSQKLSKISLLNFREILEIKRQLVKTYAAVSENAFNSYQHLLQHSAILPSGIERIDNFLGGGLFTGNIYEICGKACSGKSLLAYVFMKNVIMEMKQNCLLLDSKNDFDSHKFSFLCTEYSKVDINCGLSKILIKHVNTKYDLLNSLQEIAEKEHTNFSLKMIILDSLSSIMLNTSTHSENNLILSHIANLMHYISYKYHIVFLMTNLVITWIEGDFKAQSGTKNTISCGRLWYTIPNTRLKLENNSSILKITVEKSNMLPLTSVSVPLKELITE
ncbi:hypothetical protein WA026_017224 [Henosepilachna vigintioctopunctata]|uniref:RecA family profile 1 domain-containing protein n=1 Tax=Henosepilachna vigintioctopunctata TaxID=420089 RepID=A0AAW1ULP5_9CUCU